MKSLFMQTIENMFKTFGFTYDPVREKDPTLQDYKLFKIFDATEKQILKILSDERLTSKAKKQDVRDSIEQAFKVIDKMEQESDTKHELTVQGAYKTALVEPTLTDTEKLRRAMVSQEIRNYIRETYGNDFTAAIAKEGEFLKSPDFIRAFADCPIPSVQKQFMGVLENKRDEDGERVTVQDLMILARNPEAAVVIKTAKKMQQCSETLFSYAKQEVEGLSHVTIEAAKRKSEALAKQAEQDSIVEKIKATREEGGNVTEL